MLAVGASAKGMLKRSEGILSLRGQWIPWPSSDGARTLPAMATLHPAILLRQPLGKKRAWHVNRRGRLTPILGISASKNNPLSLRL